MIALFRRLQKLDNLKDQKLQKLGQWDADCANVVQWLEQNKETNTFAQRVTLPAYVSLTVRDQRYVNAIEACLGANQIKVRDIVERNVWCAEMYMADFCNA